MKKFTLHLLAFAALLLCASCARELVVEEVLQLPAMAKVRTAYNLRYVDPDAIDSMNYQNGSILPFGTEVEILSATENEIRFRTPADDKKFRILFDARYRMQTPEEYLRELFTDKSPEVLTEGIAPGTVEKIRRALVERGMTRQEVRLAYGPPCKFKTPDETLDTWLFWSEFLIGKRIVFNDNRVVEILEL